MHLPHCVWIHLYVCVRARKRTRVRVRERMYSCSRETWEWFSPFYELWPSTNICIKLGLQYLTTLSNTKFHGLEFLQEFTCWFLSEGKSKTMKELSNSAKTFTSSDSVLAPNIQIISCNFYDDPFRIKDSIKKGSKTRSCEWRWDPW